MDTKEQFDAILAELHKRYGGEKKRLESLKRMTYMDRDLDESFLVKNSKQLYGKSCTRLLEDEGILWKPYGIENERLYGSVNDIFSCKGKKIRVKYQPSRVLGNIAGEIDAIQNGGVAYSVPPQAPPLMAVPKSVADYFDNVVKPIENETERFIASMSCSQYVEKADRDTGLDKLKMFVELCLLFTQPAAVEKILPLAPTKADGTLCIRRNVLIAQAGVTIGAAVPALVMHNDAEDVIVLKIKRISSKGSVFRSLKDVPDAYEAMKKYSE